MQEKKKLCGYWQGGGGKILKGDSATLQNKYNGLDGTVSLTGTTQVYQAEILKETFPDFQLAAPDIAKIHILQDVLVMHSRGKRVKRNVSRIATNYIKQF